VRQDQTKRKAAQHAVDKRTGSRVTQDTGLTVQFKLAGDMAAILALPERYLAAAQDTNPSSPTFGEFTPMLDMDGLV